MQDHVGARNLATVPGSSLKKNVPETLQAKQNMKDSIVESRNSDFKTVYNQHALTHSKAMEDSAQRRDVSREINL